MLRVGEGLSPEQPRRRDDCCFLPCIAATVLAVADFFSSCRQDGAVAVLAVCDDESIVSSVGSDTNSPLPPAPGGPKGGPKSKRKVNLHVDVEE